MYTLPGIFLIVLPTNDIFDLNSLRRRRRGEGKFFKFESVDQGLQYMTFFILFIKLRKCTDFWYLFLAGMHPGLYKVNLNTIQI